MFLRVHKLYAIAIDRIDRVDRNVIQANKLISWQDGNRAEKYCDNASN